MNVGLGGGKRGVRLLERCVLGVGEDGECENEGKLMIDLQPFIRVGR